jgi:hypothetical protein
MPSAGCDRIAQQEAGDDQNPEELPVERTIVGAAHLEVSSQGSDEQHGDGAEHGENTAQLVGNRAQDRVDGRKYHSGTMCAGVTSGLAGM